MPISREEFEQGRLDLTLPIFRLLGRFPNLAFTADEVHEMLNETGLGGVTALDIEEALETLAAQGLVQEKEIEGRDWYTISEREERRLGFLRE